MCAGAPGLRLYPHGLGPGHGCASIWAAAPQHFYYDISSFTDEPEPHTVVAFCQKPSPLRGRQFAGKHGQCGRTGGTAILAAMEGKLKDFTDSREARAAKVRYLIVFTDGADSGTVRDEEGRRELTPEAKALMAHYRQAGIAVIAVGIGQGAEDVSAFSGSGQHFVRVQNDRTQDIRRGRCQDRGDQGPGGGLPAGRRDQRPAQHGAPSIRPIRRGFDIP